MKWRSFDYLISNIDKYVLQLNCIEVMADCDLDGKLFMGCYGVMIIDVCIYMFIYQQSVQADILINKMPVCSESRHLTIMSNNSRMDWFVFCWRSVCLMADRLKTVVVNYCGLYNWTDFTKL